MALVNKDRLGNNTEQRMSRGLCGFVKKVIVALAVEKTRLNSHSINHVLEMHSDSFAETTVWYNSLSCLT